jgi:hypothetical protein
MSYKSYSIQKVLCNVLPCELQSKIWKIYMSDIVLKELEQYINNNKNNYENEYNCIVSKTKSIICKLKNCYNTFPELWHMAIDSVETLIEIEDDENWDTLQHTYNMLQLIKNLIIHPSLLQIELIEFLSKSREDIKNKKKCLKKIYRMIITHF